jgi:4-hydroxybenzoate polyprenyltransferase
MCVCIAIYVINGITDIHGDRRNRSSRPIASGALDTQTATQVIVWLALVGLFLAALVSIHLVIVFVLMFVVGCMYSCGAHPLKKNVAGVMAGGTALGVLTYFAGWLSTCGGTPGPDAIVLGVGMSLWMGLVGTSTKELKDVPGDRLSGRRTLPILLGTRCAKLVVATVALTYGCLFLQAVRSVAPGMILPAWCVLVGAVGVAVAACRSRGPRAGRNAYDVYMITQYAVTLWVLV